MKTLRIVILFSFLLSALGVHAQENLYAKRDSMRAALQDPDDAERLRTFQRLAATYSPFGSDDAMLDTLFSIYAEYEAEAVRQDKSFHQANARMNKIIAYFNRKEYDKVIELAPAAMEYMEKEEVWDRYFQTDRLYVEAYLYTGDHTKALEEAQKMRDLAAKQSNDEATAISLFTMSKIYSRQLRHEEMESCLRQSIELLKDSETMIDMLATTWFNLSQCLLTQKRYDEALAAAQEMEKVNIRRDEKNGFVAIPQQANLWNLYVRLYTKLGEYDKAEKYCDKVDEITDSKHSMFSTTKARANIYTARGQYSKALETIEKAMEYTDGPHSASGNDARGVKIRILSLMGRGEEAFELFEAAVAVNDSLRNVEFAHQIDELRTQYEVDKHIAEKDRQRIVIYWILSACILLLIGLFIVGIFYRQKQKAYKDLVKKNQQWAGVGRSDKEETNEYEPLPLPDTTTEDLEIGETVDQHQPDTADLAVMDGVEQLMKEKKLFVQPDVSLDMLAEELGIHRRLISGAINRCTKKHFFAYINEYRIKEAIRIMSEKDNRDLTIDAIAFDAGFNDRKTFHRIFKQYTGLTPSAFRKNMEAEG